MSTSVDQTPGETVVTDEEVEGSRPRACWSVRECDWRDGLPEDVIELLAPPVIVSAEGFVPAVESAMPAHDVQPAVLDGEAEVAAVPAYDVQPAVLDGEAEAVAVPDGEAEVAAVPDGETEAPASPDDPGPAAYRPRHAAPEEPQVTFTVPPRRLRRRRPAAA